MIRVLSFALSFAILPSVAWSAPVAVQLVGGMVDDDGYARLSLVLDSGTSAVGGAQADLLFDRRAVHLVGKGCKVGSAIGSQQPGCGEDPVVGPCKNLVTDIAKCDADVAGCEERDQDFDRARLLVAATAVLNSNSIPSGAVLATCTFAITDLTRLPVSVGVRNLVASDVAGRKIASAGLDGVISLDGITAMPTSTIAATPTATETPEALPTETEQVPPACVLVFEEHLPSWWNDAPRTEEDLIQAAGRMLADAPPGCVVEVDGSQWRRILMRDPIDSALFLPDVMLSTTSDPTPLIMTTSAPDDPANGLDDSIELETTSSTGAASNGGCAVDAGGASRSGFGWLAGAWLMMFAASRRSATTGRRP